MSFVARYRAQILIDLEPKHKIHLGARKLNTEELFLLAKSPIDNRFTRCCYQQWLGATKSRCANPGEVRLNDGSDRKYCRAHIEAIRKNDKDRGIVILNNSIQHERTKGMRNTSLNKAVSLGAV